MSGDPPRALITAAAVELLTSLQERHGALLFHQFGGCRDGSSPGYDAGGAFAEADRSLQSETPVARAQAGVAFVRGGRIPNTGSSVVAAVVEAYPVR